MFRPSKIRLISMIAFAALLSVSAAVVRGMSPVPVTVKLTPSMVFVDTSSIAPKLAEAAMKEVWRLFDRDTETAYMPPQTARVEVALPDTRTLSRIRVYGASSYHINLYRDNAGTWELVPSLTGLNLTNLGASWNDISLSEPFSVTQLLLEFIPQGNVTSGIREIEFWGPESSSAQESTSYSTLSGLRTPQEALDILSKGSSHVLEFSAAPSELSVIEGATPAVSIGIIQNPALFKRAYIVYDGHNLVRPVSIQRRINGLSWAGGFAIPQPETATPAWSSYIEEINPAWLIQGENRIEFRTSTGIAAIRGLKLIIEADSGWNSVSSISSRAVYDGDAATSYEIRASAANPVVQINFERTVQPEKLRLHIPNAMNMTANVQYLSGTTWQDVKAGWQIDFATLQSSWNEISLPAPVTTEALRIVFNASGLKIKPGVQIGAINEVRVSASAVGSLYSSSQIVISYPRDGEYFGRTAYIQGFAVPASNPDAAQVSIEGKTSSNGDGSFSLALTKEETRFSAQGDDESWEPVVKTVYSGQTGASVSLLLNKNSGNNEQTDPKNENRGNGPFADNREKFTDRVSPGQAKKIQYRGVTLDIPAGAVDKDTDITIIPLADPDLARLNPGMINVTFPDAGYRFLPHGMKFKKPIKISFGYSKQLFSASQVDDEVNMYYYDESFLRWVKLNRMKVDPALSVVESQSDHFTDIINSTLVVPEHPQALSFNPNSIKDIKAADPSANVNLIEPPTANNRGSANLSYPIEVPPGRNKLQPSLAVQYNSSGGNGWMGLGWDIPMQSISIDTRWGAPRYDGAMETETYMIEGEQLAPVAHRGELKARTENTTILSTGETVKIFHPRVEGQFRRIIRHGSSPSTYWWEVIDKNGTRYLYGGGSDTNGPASDSTLTDDSSNVFLWSLREIRDRNNNFVRYHCVRVSDSGTAGGASGVNLYLQKITYTGSGTTEGQYSVTFIRDRKLEEPLRIDKQTDGRGRFKRVTADLLRKVEVSLGSQLIRRYEFRYNEKPYGDNRPGTAFYKTLLTSISQYGATGAFFNKHEFRYYDEARNTEGTYHGFQATSWTAGNDTISAGLMGYGDASALGGNTSQSGGGHLYLGVGTVGNTSSKNVTVGFKIGYSESDGEALVAMADMDGDGLADKIFKNDGYYYRKNLSGPHGNASFGEPVLIGLPGISHDSVTSTTWGIQLFFYVPLQYDSNTAETQNDTYFSDVNGDGLTDVVSGGAVYFNHLDEKGVPTFTMNSADTPAPITSGNVYTNGLLPDPSGEEAERADKFPLLDAIRRWVAPYDGTVSIDAPVHLIQDASEARAKYTKADGVQVAIQLEGVELWSLQTVSVNPGDQTSPRILADDYTIHTPTGVNTVPVKRGDRLYFRVQSVYNGLYDQVEWDPIITYLNRDTTRTDVNSLTEYAYRASQDFTLAGRRSTLTLPVTGTLHLAGTLVKKGDTTDDITLLITRNGAEVYSHTLGFADKNVVVNLSEDLAVTKEDVLEWRVMADSPIDVTQIQFTPSAYYTAIDGIDRVTDEDGNYMLKVNPLYDIDLYSVNTLTAPQSHLVTTQTGTMTVVPSVSFDNQAPLGDIAFTVKKRTSLLGKGFITLSRDADGKLIISSPTLIVPVSKDEELFFDFSTRDTNLAGHLISSSVLVTYDTNTTPVTYIDAPSAFHSAAEDNAFPVPFRGWGAVGYNGNSPRDSQPIDQSLLVLDSSFDPENARVYPFAPNAEKALWGGMENNAWVKSGEAMSSRLGLKDIRMLHSEDFAGAIAPPRISKSTNDAGTLIVSASEGESESKVDFQDLNGDRFPDVIGNSGVQYTAATGELASGTTGGAGLGSARSSSNESFNVSSDAAGNIAAAIGNGKGDVAPSGQKGAASGQQSTDMPRLGLSANGGHGTSDTDYDLIDINGDGLPDKVFNGGALGLNLGYRFVGDSGGLGAVNSGSTDNAGVSMSYNSDWYSLAGGINIGLDETKSTETYLDINGDGLPDKISGSSVMLNTGSSFVGPITWAGASGDTAKDKHVSMGGGIYFTFGFNFTYVRIVINIGGNYSKNIGRPEIAYRDIDGDGNVDLLTSTKANELGVALNQIGRTNLLKSVKRPLGGKFEINYTREGNTYEMPQSQWIMTNVKLTDGMRNTYRTDYTYSDPHQDRYEREFYGFKTVKETHASGTGIARQIVQTYYTGDYYRKGLVQSTVTRDMKVNPGFVWSKSENDYQTLAIKDDKGDALDYGGFPALTTTTNYFFDGSSTEETEKKKTYQTFEYDDYGNVKTFKDFGELLIGDDDVRADIDYYYDLNNYIIKPGTIIVAHGSNQLRKRVATYYGNGNLHTLTQHNTKGPESVWTFEYYNNGNLSTIADPVGYKLKYDYDPDVQTYVTQITDNFPADAGGPYYSTAAYNLSFGQPDWSRDLTLNYQVNLYDEFGRMVAVCSPYDTVSPSCAGVAAGTLGNAPVDAKPTIAFTYTMPGLAGEDNDFEDASKPAHALTYNKAVSVAGSNPIIIRTLTYADGMKRVIQTKKDADVDDGAGAPIKGMTVSGKVKFDELGRVTQQGQPNFEPSSENYVPYTDFVHPTYFAYDTLDRTIEILTPDDKASNQLARTTTAYSFDQFNGRLYATTTVVDPEGNRPNGPHNGTKTSYKDVDDRIVAVVEHNWIKDPATNLKIPVKVVTAYEYDPLGQITTVVDNKGNTTTVDYDDLGRRLTITNPDTGKTTYKYDSNGNLTSKFTAKNDKITYNYVFNRLMDIDYNAKTGSVSYSYGAMNESYNRAGRIKKVIDESGEEVRFYGRLGETTREEKTVLAHTPAVQKKKFSTDYVFDSFGRMVDMTYPDGEKLHYTYDNGGLLKAAWGDKDGNRYNYINSLLYDKFGQRTHITYGNGTKSMYTYNDLTRRLATLNTSQKDGRSIQILSYDYDLVGNVNVLVNGIQVATNTALPAGPVRQEFDYDDLYQIVDAKGWYSFGPGKGNNYRSEFLYDTIGNFARKKQEHEIIQPSTTKTFPKETNYELNYKYMTNGNNQPHAVSETDDKLYSYDLNGNMTGWTSKVNGTRRVITWNEENRVKQIDDNGKSTYFLYDDAGERVVKRGQHGETIYVNRFFTIRNGELGTKSVYAGETRVVSKLVKTPSTNTANSLTTGTSTTTSVTSSTTTTIPGINGLDNGRGKKLGIIKRLPDGYTSGGVNQPVEKDEFYYHGDHLGSSNMITDAYGAVYQHLEYFPYGETWIEEGGSYGGNTPGYKFTGKELDPETGLYYYGARYYDAVLSRWISADPAIGKYLPTGEQGQSKLPGFGGIYNPLNLNLYGYTYQNPVKYNDPDGELAFIPILVMAAGAYLGQAFLAPDIANAPAPGEETLKGPSALEQGGAMLSGATIARTALQYGTKAALKEVFEEATGLPTDIGDLAKLGKKTPGDLVKANKAKGDAFRDEIAGLMKKEGFDVKKEVSKKTPFGRRDIDVEISKDGKVLGGIETKTGNSPYKPSQRSKDEYLKRDGYPVNVVRDE